MIKKWCIIFFEKFVLSFEGFIEIGFWENVYVEKEDFKNRVNEIK